MYILAPEIAARLGLRRGRRSWHGRCPACDYADSFCMRQGRNHRTLLYCANCNDRNALEAAVARSTGHAAPAAREYSANVEATRQQRRERALAIWRGSVPAVGTLADTYLSHRGLSGLATSSALRFRKDAPHPEGGKFPTLTALVVDVDGKPMAIHRTFLAPDGSKARTTPAKASLAPVWGGAIRLADALEGVPLIIGEGIETAASAGRLLGFPAWSAVSAGNMRDGLVLPPSVRRVVIAVDDDLPGQDAAQQAAARWRHEGRRVQIAMPTACGADFNDVLMARMGLGMPNA